MIASILPEWVIDYGTDLLFITALIAGIILAYKWARGVLREVEEVVDDEPDDGPEGEDG